MLSSLVIVLVGAILCRAVKQAQPVPIPVEPVEKD